MNPDEVEQSLADRSANLPAVRRGLLETLPVATCGHASYLRSENGQRCLVCSMLPEKRYRGRSTN